MSEIRLEDYRSEIKYRHTFKNVIQTLEKGQKICSDTFFVRNLPWCVFIQSIKEENQPDSMDCYLLCQEAKEGMSCTVYYTLSALNLTTLCHKHMSPTSTTITKDVIGWCYSTFLSWSDLTTGGFLIDNALTIQIELKAEVPEGIDYQNPTEQVGQSLQQETANGLANDMKKLLESGDGDVTFIITNDSNSKVKAHKLILSARNIVFASMFSGEMKEAQNKEVIIEDMGERALKMILLHVYTGQLTLPEDLGFDTCEEVVNAAEKYGLLGLKEVAGMALARLALKTPENAMDVYKFLKRSNVDVATKALASYIKRKTDEILDKC